MSPYQMQMKCQQKRQQADGPICICQQNKGFGVTFNSIHRDT